MEKDKRRTRTDGKRAIIIVVTEEVHADAMELVRKHETTIAGLFTWMINTTKNKGIGKKED